MRRRREILGLVRGQTRRELVCEIVQLLDRPLSRVTERQAYRIVDELLANGLVVPVGSGHAMSLRLAGDASTSHSSVESECQFRADRGLGSPGDRPLAATVGEPGD
jgi:hypothetical protein